MKVAIVSVKPDIFSVFYGAIPGLAGAIISGILTEQDIDVIHIDETKGEAVIKTLREQDMVLLTAFTHNINRAYDIADKLDNPVIIGGPHVTFNPDEALNHADIVVRGLADKTLPELIWTLRNKRSLESVNGISYMESGRIKHNADREISPMDGMPVPDFSTIQNVGSPYSRHPLQLSRGCYHKCTFCSIRKILPFQQTKSIERLGEDLDQMVLDYKNGMFVEIEGEKRILLVDDNFGSRESRAQALEQLKFIKGYNLNLRIITQARVEIAYDKEILEAFYDAGGKRFLLGIESIDNRILKDIRKGTTSERAKEAVKRLKDHGFEVNGLFIVGYEDTPESVKRITDYVETSGIDTFNISLMVPFPGTEEYEMMDASNIIIDKNWDYYGFYNCVFQPRNCSPKKLEGAVRSVMYSHPLSMYNYGKKHS
jgi:anaerobic magnesium-protoporphyrin IX monomethyl ester cyclase